jgi:hypothetical protein
VRHDVSEHREMKRKVGSKKGKKVGNTTLWIPCFQ